MITVTDTLCAIERRADRAIVQELRLMTQEILAMRTHLTLEDRAHADALLLKLGHLERCQFADTIAAPRQATADALTHTRSPALAFDGLAALDPSAYLVHFYGRELGELERVELTESLTAAVQLVLELLREEAPSVGRITHDTDDGAVNFLSSTNMLLVRVQPSEPRTPLVESLVATACAALAMGDITALQHLFAVPAQAQLERQID